jgi:probable HAF family extracellular repeat protein
MFHRSTVIFGVLLLAVSAAGPGLAGPYYVTDLGILAGTTGNNSYAMAVNDYGVVAGGSSTSGNGGVFATIYTGGAWVNIGSGFSATHGSYANAINDSGQVSGWRGPGGAYDSFIYNTNTGQYTDIGAQPGVCNGVENRCADAPSVPGPDVNIGSINSSGQIVGYYITSSGPAPGYPNLFVSGGGSTSLVTTPVSNTATDLTDASGINNNGVVVGNYAAGDNPIPTGFYFNGAEHDISNMTYPQAITGNTVVGANYDYHSDTGTVTYDAMIYTLGANSATNIGTLGYADQTIPYGVSSSGTVVGTGTTSPTASAMDAFVYSNGTMTDLNAQTIGPNPFSELNVAYGISPNGNYIVGDGTVASTGYTHGFLLTPAIPGDANGDGTVDINDLTIVLAHYNQTGQTWADGEFTGDGTVDINDLTIVLAHYGDTVGSSAAGNPSAAPEPAGAVLLVCGGLAALAAVLRRRKNSSRG